MLDAAFIAREPLETTICQSEEQAKKAELIVLKGGFSTSDHSYKFEIKADGTGEIFYSDFGDDSEEFAHEIKVEELALKIEKAIREQIALQSEENALEDGETENIHAEISHEMLEEVFWEEINPTLEDPFFRSFYDDGDWGEEFQTTRGTVDELLEFLKLCALTERQILSPDDFLVVEAETEIDNACLSDCSYYTERLGELVEIACEYYKPSGFRYDYNDGCYDRQSGYCLESESISVPLLDAARGPVREKMLAMIRLREKLVQMEIEEEKIKRLTAF
ncbi:MAG: hypothetical protein WKF90_02390 [Pyrinomonadaceae bacterium]